MTVSPAMPLSSSATQPPAAWTVVVTAVTAALMAGWLAFAAAGFVSLMTARQDIPHAQHPLDLQSAHGHRR